MADASALRRSASREERVDQRGLADARLAGDRHHAAAPRTGRGRARCAGVRSRSSRSTRPRLGCSAGASPARREGAGRPGRALTEDRVLLEDAALERARRRSPAAARARQAARPARGRRRAPRPGGPRRTARASACARAPRAAGPRPPAGAAPGRLRAGRPRAISARARGPRPRRGAARPGARSRPARTRRRRARRTARPPQLERGLVGVDRGRVRQRRGGRTPLLEAVGVDLLGLDRQPVARAVALRSTAARRAGGRAPGRRAGWRCARSRERAATPGDLAPGGLDQRVGRHRASGFDQQASQNRPLLDTGQRARLALPDDLQSAEHPEVHVQTMSVRRRLCNPRAPIASFGCAPTATFSGRRTWRRCWRRRWSRACRSGSTHWRPSCSCARRRVVRRRGRGRRRDGAGHRVGNPVEARLVDRIGASIMSGLALGHVAGLVRAVRARRGERAGRL